MQISANGAVRHAESSVAIAGKAQDLQKAEGRAALGLIEAAGDVQTAPRPAADGTGLRVDVYA